MLTGSPREGYRIHDELTDAWYPVTIPRQPAWYNRQTTRGIPMNRIGVLQGTYLGIYVNMVCTFWNYNPPLNCRFCTTGQNVGEHEAADKAVSDVVETCLAAKEESGITFVHLNAGFQGTRGIEFAEPYIAAIKGQVGALVGAQLSPEKDFSKYDRLVGLGVDHLSFCVEFLNPDWFARICPGKAKMLGQQVFMDSIAYCVKKLGRGAVSGEIIAGVEPIEDTLRGIDQIAAMGAFPTVCIFRPTIGAAPNIEVSIVVNPDDTPFLAPRTPGFYAYEAYRRLVRLAAKPVFARRQRPRSRRDFGEVGEIPPDQGGSARSRKLPSA